MRQDEFKRTYPSAMTGDEIASFQSRGYRLFHRDGANANEGYFALVESSADETDQVLAMLKEKALVMKNVFCLENPAVAQYVVPSVTHNMSVWTRIKGETPDGKAAR